MSKRKQKKKLERSLEFDYTLYTMGIRPSFLEAGWVRYYPKEVFMSEVIHEKVLNIVKIQKRYLKKCLLHVYVTFKTIQPFLELSLYTCTLLSTFKWLQQRPYILWNSALQWQLQFDAHLAFFIIVSNTHCARG